MHLVYILSVPGHLGSLAHLPLALTVSLVWQWCSGSPKLHLILILICFCFWFLLWLNRSDWLSSGGRDGGIYVLILWLDHHMIPVQPLLVRYRNLVSMTLLGYLPKDSDCPYTWQCRVANFLVFVLLLIDFLCCILVCVNLASSGSQAQSLFPFFKALVIFQHIYSGLARTHSVYCRCDEWDNSQKPICPNCQSLCLGWQFCLRSWLQGLLNLLHSPGPLP